MCLGASAEPTSKEFGQSLEKQALALGAMLPDGWQVLTAMRYGHPTIEQALDKAIGGGAEELVVLPMYPHSSGETTNVIMKEVYRLIGTIDHPPDLTTRTNWHDDGGYVNAQARLIAGFTMSLELQPSDTHLVFFGHSPAAADEKYLEQVERTRVLVMERLGWPRDRSSVVFVGLHDPNDHPVQNIHDHLRDLAAQGEARVVLCSITFPLDEPFDPERVGTRFRDVFETDGGSLYVCPSIDTYGPLTTALKNIAVRGPRPVEPGTVGALPLLSRTSSSEPTETSPRSLVMIGASMAGKARSQHGPDVVFSPGGVVCTVKKSRTALRAFLDWVREETSVEESFVWSTCQRIEFYGWLSEGTDDADREFPVAKIRQHLFGAEPEGLKVNVLFGVEAWHHMMRTACGLNSALPGDLDVLSQLQTSCRMAKRVGTAGARVTKLVESAEVVAEEVRTNTSWERFSRGFCSAALSRIHDLVGADLDTCKHVVIGGSATSRSVLSTLAERYRVPQRHMTLVYRDHHGQMKLLRSAIGNGKRLRVHSYSDDSVLDEIANADFLFFGIDHANPVISADMLVGRRDFVRHPLYVIDFNDSGSVVDLDGTNGVFVWTANDLERAVESYADAMCVDERFPSAFEQVENWIEKRLPSTDAEGYAKDR